MGSTSEPLDQIRDHFSQSIATKQKVAEQCAESIQAAAELITRCFSTNNKLMILETAAAQPIPSTWPLSSPVD